MDNGYIRLSHISIMRHSDWLDELYHSSNVNSEKIHFEDTRIRRYNSVHRPNESKSSIDASDSSHMQVHNYFVGRTCRIIFRKSKTGFKKIKPALCGVVSFCTVLIIWKSGDNQMSEESKETVA